MERNNYSGGIGFTGLLAILFIALKLTGGIDWSWWWVLSPIWAPIFLGALAYVIIGAIALGMTLRGEK